MMCAGAEDPAFDHADRESVAAIATRETAGVLFALSELLIDRDWTLDSCDHEVINSVHALVAAAIHFNAKVRQYFDGPQ
jgi:hypothetical protein